MLQYISLFLCLKFLTKLPRTFESHITLASIHYSLLSHIFQEQHKMKQDRMSKSSSVFFQPWFSQTFFFFLNVPQARNIRLVFNPIFCCVATSAFLFQGSPEVIAWLRSRILRDKRSQRWKDAFFARFSLLAVRDCLITIRETKRRDINKWHKHLGTKDF